MDHSSLVVRHWLELVTSHMVTWSLGLETVEETITHTHDAMCFTVITFITVSTNDFSSSSKEAATAVSLLHNYQ